MVKMLVAGFLFAGILFMAAFAYFYVKYEGIVDRRMAGPLFNNAAKIYARPRTIAVGNPFTPQEIADYLRRAGYSEQGKDSRFPHWHVSAMLLALSRSCPARSRFTPRRT